MGRSASSERSAVTERRDGAVRVLVIGLVFAAALPTGACGGTDLPLERTVEHAGGSGAAAGAFGAGGGRLGTGGGNGAGGNASTAGGTNDNTTSSVFPPPVPAIELQTIQIHGEQTVSWATFIGDLDGDGYDEI